MDLHAGKGAHVPWAIPSALFVLSDILKEQSSCILLVSYNAISIFKQKTRPWKEC